MSKNLRIGMLAQIADEDSPWFLKVGRIVSVQDGYVIVEFDQVRTRCFDYDEIEVHCG